ncbi:SRPBCC family protein [Naumannella sp. ID2617S]|nr:SRPBCC family protein [Naumannella sp. ID2617S]
MSVEVQPLECRLTIEAAPDVVWSLVRDVTRMPEWSPYLESTRLKADQVAVGARFTNLNRQDGMDWITHGEVVELVEGERIAFRVEENWAIWSFDVSAEDGSTLLVQRRETPDGLSELSRELIEGAMGGQEAYAVASLAGMRETLQRIKAAAEGHERSE